MDILGKIVLVGMTYILPNGQIDSQYQIVGSVYEVTEERIVLKKLDSGDEFGLPPDLNQFKPASEGVYRLHNGNVDSVTDPDFIVQYNVHMSGDEKRAN